MANPPESEPTEKRVRARELGIPLGRFKTGRHNAITDVEGVLVGHSTIIRGEGPLRPGHGPVRTGVTAILPNRGNIFMERMNGGGFVLNGAGEVAGMTQLLEWGLVETPMLLTNTMSVGAASDALARHMVEQYPGIGDEHDVIIPIVGECDDSYLNDISGRHVRAEHVFEAIRNASEGPVPEGNVGGGTGMVTCDFKGGIGTASRKLPEALGGYTLGVLVMSNFGKMHNLRVGGLPVGEVLAEKFKDTPRRGQTYGSIIAVVATDAPLLSHQINRLCKRVSLGIGRVGSYAAHGSGEIVVGFSTANIIPRRTQKMVYKLKILLDQRLDPLYEAVMEATEEAILNAMCMATSMKGVNDNYVPALPLDEVRRFVQACRPIFASVKKRPQQTSAPVGRDKPADVDKEGEVTAGAVLPTEVRGAEGIPYPTRPAPDDIEDSSSGGSSGS
ncbi:MAG TPA: P1 family peptidase [Archangium sp.]|uniref:DmpA family aminopeptidase n=1 Tax=Archangium sp. TaxID=1872627 RepID=UPI002E341866|nr:P1 family peptidase [Archangium sp.]HEX5745680.1 P1 family peptidase [Archangium sp.]